MPSGIGVVFPPQRKQRTEASSFSRGGRVEEMDQKCQVLKFHRNTNDSGRDRELQLQDDEPPLMVKTVWSPFAVVVGGGSGVVPDNDKEFDASPPPPPSFGGGGGDVVIRKKEATPSLSFSSSSSSASPSTGGGTIHDAPPPPPPPSSSSSSYVTNSIRFSGYHMFVPSPRVVKEERIPPEYVEEGGKMGTSPRWNAEVDPTFHVYDDDDTSEEEAKTTNNSKSSGSLDSGSTLLGSRVAPIYKIKSAAKGCKTHGPFQCSCHFLQVLSSHMIDLQAEFTESGRCTSAGGAEANFRIGRKRRGDGGGGSYCDDDSDGVDDDGSRAGVDDHHHSRTSSPKVLRLSAQDVEDLLLMVDASSSTSVSSLQSSGRTSSNPFEKMRSAMLEYLRQIESNNNKGGRSSRRGDDFCCGVIVVCPELKYWTGIICNPDLPLVSHHRRVIGPFPLQPADKMESMEKAVVRSQSLATTTVAKGKNLPFVMPECVDCHYRGTALIRCFCCAQKMVCSNCAMNCDSCQRKSSFCSHCIVVKRVRGHDNYELDVHEGEEGAAPEEVHLCTQCI